MYELTIPTVDIVVQNQEIHLIGYEHLDESLERLGQYLTSIEVTEENIKENKRLVAQVRKACKTLNEQRIAFKKEYLKPLETLEHQVKALDNKAQGFEETVRRQIREIEEKQREEKEEEIKEVFTRRQRKYGGSDLYPFESFLKREYLNKSYSINKIEQEMADWFESRQDDINALITYSETVPQDKSEIISVYLSKENVTDTISYFGRLNEKKEQVERAVRQAPKRANKPQPKTTVLIRISEDDVERVKQLLSASQIKFEIA